MASPSIALPASAEEEQGRRVFTNLQVLPEDITVAELFENMKRITKALGVDCRSCHRTDIRDFASDEIETKRVARQMMQMVEQMNAQLSAAGADGDATITCFTCHRGNRKPVGVAPTGENQPPAPISHPMHRLAQR